MAKVFTKRQLVCEVSQLTHIPQTTILKIYAATSKIQKNKLKAGYVVKSVNGQIKIISKKARKGTNPQTGKIITIPACKKPKYMFSKEFKKGF